MGGSKIVQPQDVTVTLQLQVVKQSGGEGRIEYGQKETERVAVMYSLSTLALQCVLLLENAVALSELSYPPIQGIAQCS